MYDIIYEMLAINNLKLNKLTVKTKSKSQRYLFKKGLKKLG